MKVRRFFAFVAGAAMLFAVGCNPDDKGGADADMAEIAVNPTSFATTLEGGEQIITVTSNGAWTADCDQADVTIEPLTGNGDGSVTITVPAAAAREFKVVFNVSKQTTIPALGTTTTTTAKAEVTVSQNATGANLNNFVYYEDCGADVEKNSSGQWPYVDQFTGWNPQGPAATEIVYSGKNASVRASGNAYQPTDDAVGVSGQPYAFLNKTPDQAYFVIENIAVTGGKNYIFTYNAQCQTAYSSTPTFATVDASLIHLELGYDGTNWATANLTFAPNGGNGWYAVSSEFKVAATATKLYARLTYEAPASNGGGRFDDFKLVEGGNGAELNIEEATTPETAEVTIAAITNAGNYIVKNAWVIATYAQGFLMTDSSNGILLVFQGSGANVPAVGAVVNVEGAVSTYGGFLQFGKDGLTVTATGETKTVTAPTAETMDGAALDAWLKAPAIKYVEYVGQLSAGNYFNITVPGATTAIGSVQYPADDLKATLNGLNGKYVKVTGWLIGYSSSKYTNTMATAVVETDAPAGGDDNGGDDNGDAPAGTETIEGLTHIENLDGVAAGKYYFAAYSTKNSSAEVFTNYPYHLWTGTVTSGKADTANYAYANGILTRDPNHTSGAPATEVAVEIELVAVDGKTNVYYIKYNDKYLVVSDFTNNHKISMGADALEWTAVEHTDGIVFEATNGSSSVVLCTGTAANDLLRQYKKSSFTNGSYNGVHLFKKN